jgi:hypothetical protein
MTRTLVTIGQSCVLYGPRDPQYLGAPLCLGHPVTHVGPPISTSHIIYAHEMTSATILHYEINAPNSSLCMYTAFSAIYDGVIPAADLTRQVG